MLGVWCAWEQEQTEGGTGLPNVPAVSSLICHLVGPL